MVSITRPWHLVYGARSHSCLRVASPVGCTVDVHAVAWIMVAALCCGHTSVVYTLAHYVRARIDHPSSYACTCVILCLSICICVWWPWHHGHIDCIAYLFSLEKSPCWNNWISCCSAGSDNVSRTAKADGFQGGAVGMSATSTPISTGGGGLGPAQARGTDWGTQGDDTRIDSMHPSDLISSTNLYMI